jgi:addiction module HigA family antidote
MTVGEKIGNIHPGDVLREDYLIPLGMHPYQLAKGLKMSPTAVGQILAGKRSITPETALRLERFFGASARFWLNLQTSYDLEEAYEHLTEKVAEVIHYQEMPPPDPKRARPTLRRPWPETTGPERINDEPLQRSPTTGRFVSSSSVTGSADQSAGTKAVNGTTKRRSKREIPA